MCDEAKDASREKREQGRRDLMPGRLRGVAQIVVGTRGGVLLEYARPREALHRVMRLRYRRAERAREFVRGLRGMRGISGVAREEPGLSPCRLDRTVASEPPVESHDREREQHQAEPEG